MINDKIKVKDLAIELGVSTKDLLRVLRELEISAKSTISNISIEDLPKIRAQFNTPNTNKEEERRQIQPGVILRRKRQQPSTNQTDIKLNPVDTNVSESTIQTENLILENKNTLSPHIEETTEKIPATTNEIL